MTQMNVFNTLFHQLHFYSTVIIVVVPLLQDNRGRPIQPDLHPDSYSMSDLAAGRSRRQSFSRRDRRAATAEPAYITSELNGDSLPAQFEIGDGKEYNGFYNRPLDKGKYYMFFSRVSVMSEDGVSIFGKEYNEYWNPKLFIFWKCI